MRIRRENKGKDIVVNCNVNIDAPLDAINDNVTLNSLMENYGIPLSIEMTTKIFKAIMTDFKRKPKKNKSYAFVLVAQDTTNDN